MSQTKRAAQSILMLIIFAFFSKVFGFFRQALIAAQFGSGIETDTYFISQSANTLFMIIITSSLATTTIPIFTQITAFEGKKRKIDHASNLLSITSVVAVLISALAWVMAPLVMKVFAYGFDKEQYGFAVFMMRLGIPSILFASLSGVLNGYLQSENRFFASSIEGITQNFFFIIFLIFFATNFGIEGLMMTYIIGIVIQFIVLLIGVRATGFSYRPIFDPKDKYIQQALIQTPPILLSIAVADISSMIDKAMASTLVEGSISALNYASSLSTMVSSIFVSAITTVLYPLLSKGVAMNDIKEVKKTMVQGINLIMLITIPVTVGMLILAKPIVHIAFERGVFDSVATQMTVEALVFYTLGLVFSSIRVLIARVFYSLNDTKTPMINSVITVFLNVVMNIILIKPLAHMGLALATSISLAFTTAIVTIILRKRIGVLGLNKTLVCGIKSTLSSIIMASVVLIVYNKTKLLFGTRFLGKLVGLLIPVGVGATLYFFLLYLFKVDELIWVLKTFKNRRKRP